MGITPREVWGKTAAGVLVIMLGGGEYSKGLNMVRMKWRVMNRVYN